MIKVLNIEVNKDGTIGGSYYSLLYLLQGINKSKYEPHVMFMQDNVLVPEFMKVTPNVYIYENSYLNSLNKYKIGKWLSKILPIYVFTQYLEMNKIIKAIKPDLVHLNNCYTGYAEACGWVFACYFSGIKVITHDRGTPYPCSITTKYFVRYLNAIISVSDSFKSNVIKQKLKVKRIYRIYNGLDIDKVAHAYDSNSFQCLRKEFNLDGKGPIIGIVGNIQRWKGQIVVLKAVHNIAKTYPNIRCFIVGPVCKGEEGYQNELERYVYENGISENIIFTGYRKDSVLMMNILDVLVHASVEPEPFARVILEGMALAKPIIGTNSGGTPEQLIDNETGLLVPMGDADTLAKALTYYLSDMKRAQEIGQRGRQRLIEMFSIKKMVEQTERVYEEVISQN